MVLSNVVRIRYRLYMSTPAVVHRCRSVSLIECRSFQGTRPAFVQKGKVQNDNHLYLMSLGNKPLSTRITPTVATKMSQSSHHSRTLDTLRATNRSPTARSGRAKKMLKMAYILGAWLAWRSAVWAAMFVAGRARRPRVAGMLRGGFHVHNALHPACSYTSPSPTVGKSERSQKGERWL